MTKTPEEMEIYQKRYAEIKERQELKKQEALKVETFESVFEEVKKLYEQICELQEQSAGICYRLDSLVRHVNETEFLNQKSGSHIEKGE